VSQRDIARVRAALNAGGANPRAHAALTRLSEKARRFDSALLVLAEQPLPAEHQELARRIAEELRR
jgi:hypothetical protein